MRFFTLYLVLLSNLLGILFMDVVILVSLHLHKFLTCLILMTNNMKKSYYGKPMVYPNAALISEINAKPHSNVG